MFFFFLFYGASLTILHKWYKLNDIWSFLIYETTVSGFRVLKLDRLGSLNLRKEVGKNVQTQEYYVVYRGSCSLGGFLVYVSLI